MPDAEIGLDLHVEAGDALMQLRYAQGDLAGGGMKARGSQRERLRVLLGQATAQAGNRDVGEGPQIRLLRSPATLLIQFLGFPEETVGAADRGSRWRSRGRQRRR